MGKYVILDQFLDGTPRNVLNIQQHSIETALQVVSVLSLYIGGTAVCRHTQGGATVAGVH